MRWKRRWNDGNVCSPPLCSRYRIPSMTTCFVYVIVSSNISMAIVYSWLVLVSEYGFWIYYITTKENILISDKIIDNLYKICDTIELENGKVIYICEILWYNNGPLILKGGSIYAEFKMCRKSFIWYVLVSLWWMHGWNEDA